MIYFDYQATTPLAPEARDAMLRWLDGADGSGFGNPNSPHRLGRQAAAAIELARERVTALLPPGGKVIFTSGATEALNLAIRGTADGGDGRIAVSTIEHLAVSDTVRSLGCPVDEIAVDGDGLVQLPNRLDKTTRMIAVMQVNNEIGTVQPALEVARMAKEAGALFLCDAVQAAGKMDVAGADLIAVAGHKIHGPKGVGALWVRDGVELDTVQTGGGQEQGLRAGTLSPALCAGFGAAAKVAQERMAEDAEHVAALWNRARDMFDGWTLNGSSDARYFGNLNIRKDGLDVARLMSDARDVCFSAGSACASGSGKPSHVLAALGLSQEQAKSSVRLGFGRYTTMADLEQGVQAILTAAKVQGV
ncbi:cysteine desulfurase family protein [Pontixanthobacter aquaemixtae]|uniref:Cysteine desulfurase n=1 Tax=Pontixanthobacter aquaemixtae TaxID=1958940 RepID=A0A844ZMK2_9SPHN|nr:cysteine desulfurase family protein [Pontixanthobacter aquaemixtae]MXO89621.1 aminotransferase class V-fold PLP-dependent enzyme [Pontixanthobacter aquaemixtae]